MAEYLNLNTMEEAKDRNDVGQDSDDLAKDLLSTVNNPGLTDDIKASNLHSKLQRSGGKYNLDYLYSEKRVNGTLLHFVARENLPKVAEVLIEKGADPNSRDLRGNKYCPLHYAAEKGHPLIMKTLLKGGANANTTESLHWRSSLHLLAEKWTLKDNNNEDVYKECLDILLDSKEINVDIQNKDRNTPIFLAAENKWEYMVKKLIISGANLNLTGEDNIKNEDQVDTKLPGLIQSIDRLKIKVKKTVNYYAELKQAMKAKNLERFNNIISDIDDSKIILLIIDSEEDQGITLLQYACDNGLADFAELLLRYGADPLKFDKTNLYSPILHASEKGYSKSLEILVKHLKKSDKIKIGLNQRDQRGETPLHKAVKQEYRKEGSDHKRCVEIILDCKSDVDATDMHGNTPLHHAALQEDQSLAKLLLLGGAHLGIKNDSNIMAITNLKASVLEDVLNNSIKLNRLSDNAKLDLSEIEIILNYRMFVPTYGEQQPETECIKFISGSNTHRYLLRHPIINTFLSLKWQKISKYYHFNLVSYIIYLFLLTAYILIFHGSITEQPTNTTITGNVTEESNKMEYKLSDIRALKIFLQIIISLITLCIGIKEMTQLFLSWHSYITSFKNWLEISIVVMTFTLLFAPLSPTDQQSMSAWIVLFSWTIFILILGCHPSLAIYITMFRRVTHNFTKFIFLFSFMIFAFSLSFYLIFQVDENFKTIQKTFLKTIAMSTGELEYTDLPLKHFPITSHLLFVLFILFILMVIMNLINGLAVSDIHMIQQEAEIYSYKNRVELISYLESVFLADTSTLSRLSPGAKCCSYNPITRLMKWFGPHTLLMFPTCLRNHSIKMFPNRNNTAKRKLMKSHIRASPANQESLNYEICTCTDKHTFNLEQSHIESTMSVVLADKIDLSGRISQIEDQLKTKVSDRITQMEDRLTNLDITMTSLTDMIKAVHNQVVNKKSA
ncbi:unnamed protein product, partial [Meganyctiphanes norvegica]